jgi:hypothetical protein
MLLFLSDHNETLIFSKKKKKILKYKILWKIHPLGAELFHADRHDEANGPFPYFANVSKINWIWLCTKILTSLSDEFIIIENSKKKRRKDRSQHICWNKYNWLCPCSDFQLEYFNTTKNVFCMLADIAGFFYINNFILYTFKTTVIFTI